MGKMRPLRKGDRVCAANLKDDSGDFVVEPDDKGWVIEVHVQEHPYGRDGVITTSTAVIEWDKPQIDPDGNAYPKDIDECDASDRKCSAELMVVLVRGVRKEKMPT